MTAVPPARLGALEQILVGALPFWIDFVVMGGIPAWLVISTVRWLGLLPPDNEWAVFLVLPLGTLIAIMLSLKGYSIAERLLSYATWESTERPELRRSPNLLLGTLLTTNGVGQLIGATVPTMGVPVFGYVDDSPMHVIFLVVLGAGHLIGAVAAFTFAPQARVISFCLLAISAVSISLTVPSIEGLISNWTLGDQALPNQALASFISSNIIMLGLQFLLTLFCRPRLPSYPGSRSRP